MNNMVKIMTLFMLPVSSVLHANARSSHNFPMEDFSKNNNINNANDFHNQVKPYEWYEQRTKWLMEKTLRNQQRYEQIERQRQHDWNQGRP